MTKCSTLVACGVLMCATLVGCGDTPVATDQPAQPETTPATTSKTFNTRQVVVEIHEGTNLSVTVDPPTQNRVVSLQGQLFLLTDDAEPRALTSPYYDAREPRFAADGASVVFHGYRAGNWDIYRVSVSPGSEPVQLTMDLFDDREPVMAPDGTCVLFSSDRGGNYDIWSLSLDPEDTLASGTMQQLSESQGQASSPSMNSAGDLAYAERVGSNTYVVITGAQAAGRRLLAEHTGEIAGVSFSPDGQHVSYQVMDGAGTRMYVVPVDNPSAAEVVSTARTDVFPFRADWLADDALVYVADGRIWRRNLAEGTEVDWPFSISLQLERHEYMRRSRDYDPATQQRALGLNKPVVSNDGSIVYFSALGDLWQWQHGTGDLQRLTDDSFAESSPALSPDGGTLAFVGDRSGQVALHMLDLTTGQVSEVPVNANQVSVPSWSPDGQRLAFFIDVLGNPLGGQMMVLELETGEVKPVLSPMPTQPISWRADGQRLAVTRLNTYSSRYREGLYELVVADLSDAQEQQILPIPHRSISDAVLMADGAMTYLQGGVLHRLELDENQQPLENPVQLTSELTDMPSFSSDGSHLVYLNGQRLKLYDVTSGQAADITPALDYQRVAPEDSYVLRAGRVYPGQGDVYLEQQDIYVAGNHITKVVPTSADVVPDVDFSDKTIIPGLFEMHAHMGDNSETQGRVWLAHGITTVRDPGSHPFIAKERQESWDSGRRVGPRTHITGYLTDGNRVFYSMAEGIVSDEHLELALSRTEALQLDFVKTYVRLPDHLQKRVVEFAHDLGIPVSSHELYPAVAHGMDHVEHIGGTSRRGYQPKVSRMGYSYQDVVALLAEGGMGMTATAVLPGFAVIVAEEPDWFETPQFETFYGLAVRRGYELMVPRFGANAARTAEANGGLLRALTEAGGLLVTGTDSPFVPYGAGLHAEFRLYDRAGLSGAQILHQATMRSALAAGVDGELGQIAPGMLADMVVIDGDPLANIRDADNVVMTIKNGFRYSLPELLAGPERAATH